MRRLALALCLAAAPAAAQEALHGTWEVDGSGCDLNAVGPETPIAIGPGGFRFGEYLCPITSAEPTGVGQSWRLEMDCSAAGAAARIGALAMLDAEGRLGFYWEDGRLFTATSCPE